MTTASAELPVSVANAKAYLRVDGTDQDSIIEDLIRAAWSRFEQETSRTLLTTEYIAEMQLAQPVRGFLSGQIGAYNSIIRLPRLPLISVESVSSESTFGTWSEISETFAGNSETGEIYPESGWPSQRLRIAFTAGYGASETDIPADIKLGLYRLVATMYDNRQDLSNFGGQGSLPFDAESFFENYKVPNL